MTAEKRGGLLSSLDELLLMQFVEARKEYANGNTVPLQNFNALLDNLPEEKLRRLIPRFKDLSQRTNNRTKPFVPESAMATPGETNPYDR